ncbi:MAG: hypothetical protein U9R74_03900 [Pseudomonadota bacterium]|nr:hypothetical protein [Pseudomonadota bacterium]
MPGICGRPDAMVPGSPTVFITRATRPVLPALVIFLAACTATGPGPSPDDVDDAARTDAERFAIQVVEAISRRDMDAIARMTDPQTGLRFSPAGYLDEQDIVLDAAGLKDAWRSNRVFLWGYRDGSGEPIELPIRDYFDEFVADLDYSNAPRVATNRVLGTGNTVVNILAIFPDAEFVEFYFPGQDPRFEGLDWRSLRVILGRRPDGGWWLLGLSHDQWTI